MKSVGQNELFDLILSAKALVKATALGIVLIELKLIIDQRKQIEDFDDVFEDVGNLFQEMQAREDIPTDIKHKIDSLLNNQSKRGE